MVKVAIAGASQLANEVIDVLVAAAKHEVVIFSRRDAAPEDVPKGTAWVKVDYQDKKGLVRALQGVHTVLSFNVLHTEADFAEQKNLIDAAIEAGVKRFAPSEWAVGNLKHLDFYRIKLDIRSYLREKNKNKKVIEYTLFQPGWFMNYHGGGRQTAKFVETRRSILPTNHDEGWIRVVGDLTSRVSYTAVHDIANIVVKAIDYEGEWPEIGGINGDTLSRAEEVAIGEKLTGKRYRVDTISIDDAKAGKIPDSWIPKFNWPNFNASAEEKRAFERQVFTGLLLSIAEGGSVVSDEWNRIFPDYKFTKVEEFLKGVYAKDA
ncbi:hypothetical protein MYCTH_2305464 [Thermothelomyces thermophilus ATCC 42464]|uniref:NmrA-like domain-containing protein n=1 Tax=Thermothelomyces thermophilus (strain ATCC 42464 / BCRC 31852 / DSM 1799) TaxID=573729 RepID=G2QD43_THET4|nr:uncharacterized protein MYCTH_2305464 [Thermothelomyces thermophilus ATCC 42464]AEO58261.1 hypothetical protein MYCTH_2305464 [Thermothelomyces thermophilus ATCC 42464]